MKKNGYNNICKVNKQVNTLQKYFIHSTEEKTMKTLTIEKTTNSPRGLKAQTTKEKELAQAILKKANFENVTIVIEYNQNLYACKMPLKLVLKQLCNNGNRNKILCPLGKIQVIELIASGDLKKIGLSSDLEKYHNSNRYKITNDGQAIEYYLKQKYHCKFDHNAKMTNGNGEFKNTEVKFFSFDKTTGTPSATCESTKAILK